MLESLHTFLVGDYPGRMIHRDECGIYTMSYKIQPIRLQESHCIAVRLNHSQKVCIHSEIQPINFERLVLPFLICLHAVHSAIRMDTIRNVFASGSIDPTTLIWLSIERSFPPARFNIKLIYSCQFWSKFMTSKVEQGPKIITVTYGQHRG